MNLALLSLFHPPPKGNAMPRTKVSSGDVDTFIGERVRSFRKMRGLTLKELSEKLGISFVYLGQMERGESPWKISMLSDIAQVLNAPLTLLQDPTVPFERLQRVSKVLSQVVDLPEERLAAVEHLLEVLNS